MTLIQLSKMFQEARKQNKLDHASGETAKLGNLRAGSSGVLTSTGEVAGSCVRTSHLRSLGIEIEEKALDKYIMFELGYANETVIYDQLKAVLPEGQILLQEEEIPVEWLTRNGGKVTGRPDIVICRTTGADPNLPTMAHNNMLVQPILGLELKSVHSLWTARGVFFQMKPKIANVIQAAHYMWQLGVPYKLMYKSYSQLGQGMAGTSEGWVAKLFPRPGEPMSEFIDYTYYEKVVRTVKNRKTGELEEKEVNSKVDEDTYNSLPYSRRDYGIRHIKQFEVIFDMKADESGRVYYKHEDDTQWTPTIVTLQDIQNYFEFTSQMVATGNLGPRPAQVDTFGDKASYSLCQYCPLQATCDAHEKSGYEKWLEEVKKVAVSK